MIQSTCEHHVHHRLHVRLHESKVYFSQVKHFNNFRNRIESQTPRRGRVFIGEVANILGRISVYRVYRNALSTTAEDHFCLWNARIQCVYMQTMVLILTIS
jgi:hypothetical protein